MNRRETLETLNAHFNGSTLFLHASDFQGKRLPEAPYARPDGSLLLKAEHYTRLLSSSGFFVAAPGGAFPLAHNLADAMVHGCVPILEYPEYLNPALKHGSNCLAFRGPESLSRTLEKALSMPPREIAAMRQSVLDYARRHLEIGVLGHHFARGGALHRTLLIYSFHQVISPAKPPRSQTETFSSPFSSPASP